MPKAINEPIPAGAAPTQAKHAFVPAALPSLGSVSCPGHVTDPDAYALVLAGDCLAPHVCHGETAIFSPAALVDVGTIVALWPSNGGPPVLKRVVTLPMFPVGTCLHLDSTVAPIVVVEQDSPPGRFGIRIDELHAMHAMVAICGRGEVLDVAGVA